MPNRILKDSICTSENIDVLSADEEVFWYRLIVQCDDYGRMDARPAILRARCYPLRIDTVGEQDVSKWLTSLRRAGLIHIYTVDDRPYLQIATWDKHQQVRAKRSKYPPMISDDINGNQLQSDAPVIQSNPIQSNAFDGGGADVPDDDDSPIDGTGDPYSDADFALVNKAYEQNIGLLSPMIADNLKSDLKEYPAAWIVDAIEIAVRANVRRLNYVEGILERWKREGRGAKPNGNDPFKGVTVI